MSLFDSKENKALYKATGSLLKAAGVGKDAKFTYGLTPSGKNLVIEFTDKRPHNEGADRENGRLDAILEQAGIENGNKVRIIPGTEDENGRPDATPAVFLVDDYGRSIRSLHINIGAHGGIAALTEKLNDVADSLKAGKAQTAGTFQEKLQAERAQAQQQGNQR